MTCRRRIKPIHRAILVLASIILGCNYVVAAPTPLPQSACSGEKLTMNDARNKSIELLKLHDDAYFTLDEDKLLALQLQFAALFRPKPAAPVVKSEQVSCAIAIGAPRTAGKNSDLPLLVATYETGLRNWEVDPQQNLAVMATNLITGQFRISRPLVAGKRQATPEPSATGSAPTGTLANQTLSAVRRLNLAGLWSDGLPPGRYAVSVIAYDTRSNTIIIDWQPQGDTAKPATRAPSPALTSRHDETLPDNGIRFHMPNRVPHGTPLSVQATVSVPANHVPLLKMEGSPETVLLGAVFLLMRLDNPAAISLDLAVPVAIDTTKSHDQKIGVSFAFDLNQSKDKPLATGTYKAYFTVGTAVCGPETLIIE